MPQQMVACRHLGRIRLMSGKSLQHGSKHLPPLLRPRIGPITNPWKTNQHGYLTILIERLAIAMSVPASSS